MIETSPFDEAVAANLSSGIEPAKMKLSFRSLSLTASTELTDDSPSSFSDSDKDSDDDDDTGSCNTPPSYEENTDESPVVSTTRDAEQRGHHHVPSVIRIHKEKMDRMSRIGDGIFPNQFLLLPDSSRTEQALSHTDHSKDQSENRRDDNTEISSVWPDIPCSCSCVTEIMAIVMETFGNDDSEESNIESMKTPLLESSNGTKCENNNGLSDSKNEDNTGNTTWPEQLCSSITDAVLGPIEYTQSMMTTVVEALENEQGPIEYTQSVMKMVMEALENEQKAAAAAELPSNMESMSTPLIEPDRD